jgi:hypothetical protein
MKKVLIVGKYCNRCKLVEERIVNKSDLKIYDIESIDGMVEAALVSKYGNSELPILIINDSEVISGKVKEIVEAINRV